MPEPVQRFGEFELNVASRQLRRGNTIVPLGARAIEMLIRLAATPGELVTREVLAREVWGQSAVEDNTIAAQVTALRRALAPGRYIQTVTGRGYRFLADPVSAEDSLAPERHTRSRRWQLALALVVTVAGALMVERRLSHRDLPVPWSETDDRGLIALLPLALPPGDPQLTAYGQAFAEALRSRFTPELGALRIVSTSERSRLVAPFQLAITVRREGTEADLSVRLARRGGDEALTVFNAREPLTAVDPRRPTVRGTSSRVKDAVIMAELTRSRAKPEAARDARDLVQLAMAPAATPAELHFSISLLEHALAQAPDQPQVLDWLASKLVSSVQHGWSAHREADLARAEALAAKVLFRHPDDLNALHMQEAAYMAGGRWADAIVAADRMLAAAPEITEPRLDKALALAVLGRQTESETALADVQAVPIASVETYRAVVTGLVRFGASDWVEAAHQFRLAVQMAPPVELPEPANAGLLLYLAASEARAGNTTAARDAVRHFRALVPAVHDFEAFERWDDAVALPLVTKPVLRQALLSAGF